MVSRNWQAVLLAAVAGTMTMMVWAQAPQGAVPGGGPIPIRSGLDADKYRMMTITQQGLNSSALNLSIAQKAKISQIVDAYVIEQAALDRKYPTEPGARPSPAAVQARQTALANLTAALGSVMNEEQRQTWQAAQAARRSAIEQATSRPPPGARRN